MEEQGEGEREVLRGGRRRFFASPATSRVSPVMSQPFVGAVRAGGLGILGGQRSMSGCHEPNYDPDDVLRNTESCDESIASSDEESVSTTNKLLEDALFGFFGKEAIKSLKIFQNSARMSTSKLSRIRGKRLWGQGGMCSVCFPQNTLQIS